MRPSVAMTFLWLMLSSVTNGQRPAEGPAVDDGRVNVLSISYPRADTPGKPRSDVRSRSLSGALSA